jgi:HEAT repeat protein
MPARSLGSAFRFVSAGALAGTILVGAGAGSVDLLGPGRAEAEEAIDSTSPTARPSSASAEAATSRKLPAAKAREAVRPGKDKDKDAGKSEALAPDPTLALSAELRSPEEARAVAAVKKLGELGSVQAVDILLGELAVGLPPRVAKAALDVLAARRSPEKFGAKVDEGPSTFPILSLYAHHRNPELRKQALTGLATLLPPAGQPGQPGQPGQIVPLLISALSDGNAEVRGVAAQALGDHREKSAEPHLIKLLLRKDPAAPVALGQIGGPDTARALAEMIGNVPDGMILETLGELLKRADFGPEPVRVQVVKTIGKMPGSQTLDILGDYVKESAKDKQRPSRIEAQKIIEQRTAK